LEKKRLKQEQRLEYARRKERARNLRRKKVKALDKDDTVMRPKVRLTRKMKKALRKQIKKKKELKIDVDEEMISDSDSSISSDNEEQNAELDNIFKVQEKTRPVIELDSKQNRLEETDGFMRVLSDRLVIHLDSIFKHKEKQNIDVIDRESMLNMWHLAISSLYGVAAWGRGTDDESEYNSSNMMMNIAWWRVFSDNWDKIKQPSDMGLAKILDTLLTNTISSPKVSRYINHIGVYFL
jgi:hypothetical protein